MKEKSYFSKYVVEIQSIAVDMKVQYHLWGWIMLQTVWYHLVNRERKKHMKQWLSRYWPWNTWYLGNKLGEPYCCLAYSMEPIQDIVQKGIIQVDQEGSLNWNGSCKSTDMKVAKGYSSVLEKIVTHQGGGVENMCTWVLEICRNSSLSLHQNIV